MLLAALVWLPSCQHTHISNLLVCDGCRDLLHLHDRYTSTSKLARPHPPHTLPLLCQCCKKILTLSQAAAHSPLVPEVHLSSASLMADSTAPFSCTDREECGIAVTQPRAIRPQTGCIGAVPMAIPYIHTTKASGASTASNTQAGRDANTRKRHRCRIAPPLYTHGCGPCDHA